MTASVTHHPSRITITSGMLRQFAELICGLSSLHTDSPFGRQSMYHDNIVHGVLRLAFIPASPNSKLCALSARFSKPVYIDDALLLESSGESEIDFAFRRDSTIVNS